LVLFLGVIFFFFPISTSHDVVLSGLHRTLSLCQRHPLRLTAAKRQARARARTRGQSGRAGDRVRTAWDRKLLRDRHAQFPEVDEDSDSSDQGGYDGIDFRFNFVLWVLLQCVCYLFHE
jgi:hypothetical protein